MAILGSGRENNLGMRVKRLQDGAELRVTRGLGQRLEDWGQQLYAGRAKKLELNFPSLCPDPGRQPSFAGMGRKHSALSPAPLPSPWSTQAATGERGRVRSRVLRDGALQPSSSKKNSSA